MGLLRNKKGVEGLPLKYVIIALVAVVVIGMALYVTDSLGTSVKGATDKVGDKLTERTTCELDNERPVVENWQITCNATTNELSVVSVKITDECGIEWAKVEFRSDGNFEGLADLKLKDASADTWWTDGALNFTDSEQVIETWDIQDGDEVFIWVKDKAPSENYATVETITCD